MGDDRIAIIEPDAGQSGTDSENGNGKSGGPSFQFENRTSGFIDPELARRTGGSHPNGSGDAPSGPAKRGPGRPRKDGQPTGSGPSPRPTSAAKDRGLNINGIEKILFSIHAVAASVSQIPELELDEEECKRLASAIQNVNAAYKIEFDPKKAAMFDLMTACGIVYGPRAVTVFIRKRSETKMARKPVLTPDPPVRPNPAPAKPAEVKPVNFNQPVLDNSDKQPPELKKNESPGKPPPGFDPANIKLN